MRTDCRIDNPAGLPVALGLGLVVGASIALGAIGCGPEDRVVESSVRYVPPDDHRIAVEVLVALPIDAAWSALVEGLEGGPFRLLTADRDSRFLVADIDRSTAEARAALHPDRLVDCGRIERVQTRDGRREASAYSLAESGRHVELEALAARAEGAVAGADVPTGVDADEQVDAYALRDVRRLVTLDARSTVALRPEEAGTRVTVQTRYTLTLETTGTTRRIPRRATEPEGDDRTLTPTRETVRLTKFAPWPIDHGPEGVAWPPGRVAESEEGEAGGGRGADAVCRATGEIERRLLALVRDTTAAGASPELSDRVSPSRCSRRRRSRRRCEARRPGSGNGAPGSRGSAWRGS